MRPETSATRPRVVTIWRLDVGARFIRAGQKTSFSEGSCLRLFDVVQSKNAEVTSRRRGQISHQGNFRRLENGYCNLIENSE